MTIDDYLAAMERGLRQNVHVGRIEEPITCLASDDYNGLVRCRLVFWDDSYLDIYKVVSTELGYPVRVSYAYTWADEKKVKRPLPIGPVFVPLRPRLSTSRRLL